MKKKEKNESSQFDEFVMKRNVKRFGFNNLLQDFVSRDLMSRLTMCLLFK